MSKQDEELLLDGTGAVPPPPRPPAEGVTPPPPAGSLAQRLAGVSPEELVDALNHLPMEQLIPWENCNLPSGGRFYGWENGTVKVKAMNQAAERVLANYRLTQTGQAIDYLLQECCQFPPGFDANQLLVGDSMYLLYFLRGITHGNEYEFVAVCPHCQTQSPYHYDLHELLKTVKTTQLPGNEPFRVTLPYMTKIAGRDVWVELRFLRKLDVNQMVAGRKAKERRQRAARPGGSLQQKLEQKPERVELDDMLTENLQQIMVSVLGSRDPISVRRFIQRLHATDSATIREWQREHTPGIDTTVNMACVSCQADFTVELPISEGFFRPQK